MSKHNIPNTPNKPNKHNIPNNLIDKINIDMIEEVFSDYSLSSNIKKILYFNPNSKVKFLSSKTKKDEDSVRTELNRNFHDFVCVSQDGREKIFDLTAETRKSLDNRFETLIKRQEQEQEHLKLKELKTQEKIDFELSLKSLILDKNVSQIRNSFCYINLTHLKRYELSIFEKFSSDPESFFESLSQIAWETNKLKVRFTNLDSIPLCSISNLRASNLDSLVRLDCKVSSISEVRPKVVNARFECPTCEAILSVLQIDRKFREPNRCSCGRKGFFKLLTKEMVDSCFVQLKDFHVSGVSQKEISCSILDYLASPEEILKLIPGRDVRVVGLYKEVPIPLSNGSISTRFQHMLEIYDFEELTPQQTYEDLPSNILDYCKKISSEINNNCLDKLISSYAPDIYERKNEKISCIIQDAQPRNILNSDSPNCKSNILFIGDPGVAKSQIAKFKQKINPGAEVVSCSGATHVGLTATVEKDLDLKSYILKPGVLGLAPEVVILDEFNLLPDDQKPKLQEALYDKKISINKASIHASIPVTCGVLALANPVTGQFNPNESIIRQFNIYPPILNRFDLVFSILDSPNPKFDSEVAKKIYGRYKKTDVIYSEEQLKHFFLWCRSQPEPICPDNLIGTFADIYSECRKLARINARFGESLLRISKAHARLRASHILEERDLKFALNLLENSYLFNQPNTHPHVKEIKIGVVK